MGQTLPCYRRRQKITAAEGAGISANTPVSALLARQERVRTRGPEDIIGEDGLLKQLIKRWWSKPWKPKLPNTWGHVKNDRFTSTSGNT
ncbi:MAG: hypothetical protein KBG00_17680, partial [Rhodoferax sp.]|nr:hypothetical protein [Rhodoferax sp.]